MDIQPLISALILWLVSGCVAAILILVIGIAGYGVSVRRSGPERRPIAMARGERPTAMRPGRAVETEYIAVNGPERVELSGR